MTERRESGDKNTEGRYDRVRRDGLEKVSTGAYTYSEKERRVRQSASL